MKRKLGILGILLTLTLLSTLIPLIQIGAAQGRPKIYVEPAENIFYTDETSVGYEFDVSIMAGDWVEPGVYSYEFKLYYDNSMLEAVAASLPEGHWMTPTLSPTNIFVVDGGTINQEEGYVSFALTLMGEELGKTGTGTIATITLKITAAPPTGGDSCALELKDVILVNPDAVQIPSENYDVILGTFQYSAPPPPWYFKVEPEIVAASAVGDNVTVKVMINNLTDEGRIIGVELKLTYPAEVLILTECVEGDFFKTFGETVFSCLAGSNRTHAYIHAFVFLVPETYENLPEGSGALCTITWKVWHVPETLTSYTLKIGDVILIDSDYNACTEGAPTCCRRLEHGTFLVPTKREDLNGDGRVDINDMTMFAVDFGSYPGHNRWHEGRADVDRNGKVNILDGVIVAKAFGWSG